MLSCCFVVMFLNPLLRHFLWIHFFSTDAGNKRSKMNYPGIVFIRQNIFARRRETDSSSLVLVKSRCMEALWESIFLLAVHGGSFSRPCWVKALILFLKSLASLPNRDFRLRGLNNNFDVNGIPEGDARGGGGWHNGQALPLHLRRSGSKWSHWCCC